MWNHSRHREELFLTFRTALAIIIAVAAGSAHAGDGKWTLRLEPMLMDVYGHDQHVLTVKEMTSDPLVVDSSAVALDTDSAFTFRGELQYTRKQWGLGVDLYWFSTSQYAESRGAAGANDEVVFEVADRSYTSLGPDDALFYEVLEDTEIASWTVDLYGMRTLAEKPKSGIQLLFGIRFGDFDNDYRAVVGIESTAGTRLDASSNYDLMMGPLVAVAGYAECGKSRIKGYLGQSVLLGAVELTSMVRDFNGSFIGEPAYISQETFRLEQDVAIPVTELRVSWTYRISRYLAAGIGAHTSVWWNLPVPPGAIPSAGSDALDENTLVFYGLLAGIELTF